MGRTRSSKHRHLVPRLHQKKGRWYYVVQVGDKRKWVALGGDYGTALQKWAEYQKQTPQTGRLFDDLCMQFTLGVVPKWSKKSKDNWPYWQKALMSSFAGVHVEDIQASHVYAYVTKRELEGRRASGLRERGVLSSLLAFAVRLGWLRANPVLGVRIKQEPPRDRYLTDAEFSAIHAHASKVVQITMELAYLTGVRIGDILKIQRVDATEDGLLIAQSKNKVRGMYTMTPELRALVARAKLLRVFSPWLICRRDGKPYTYYGFRTLWARACAAAGVQNAHFHDIRAKAATDAQRAGRDVQEFTLHRTKEMADRYVKDKQIPKVAPLSLRSTMVGK